MAQSTVVGIYKQCGFSRIETESGNQITTEMKGWSYITFQIMLQITRKSTPIGIGIIFDYLITY